MLNVRNLIAVMMLLVLPLNLWAQDDDVYFVPKKKARTQQTEQRPVQRYVPVEIVYEDEYDDADTLNITGSSRDVDEYNRRPSASSQLTGQLVQHSDGTLTYRVPATDTLYVMNDSTTITTDAFAAELYNQGYEDGMADGEDYAYSRRISRFGYSGIYTSPWYYSYYDPFYWDDYYYHPYHGYYGLYHWGYPYYRGYYGWGYGPYWYGGYYSYYPSHPRGYYGRGGYHPRRDTSGGRGGGSVRGGRYYSGGRASSSISGGRGSGNRSTVGYDGRGTRSYGNGRTTSTGGRGTSTITSGRSSSSSIYSGSRSTSSSSSSRGTTNFGTSSSRSSSSSSGSFGGGGGRGGGGSFGGGGGSRGGGGGGGRGGR